MNPSIPPEAAKQIGECLFAGRKIEAIKLYREQTRADLVTAKQAVEALEAELRAREPGRFTGAPAGRGCATVIAGLLAFAGIVAIHLLSHGR